MTTLELREMGIEEIRYLLAITPVAEVEGGQLTGELLGRMGVRHGGSRA